MLDAPGIYGDLVPPTKTELGELRRANQGVFQILARDQAPGISEGQQPVKTVRVVATVEYYLD